MRDLNAQLTRNSISESGDKIIRVWDIHTGELLEMLEAHDRGIASIAFEPSSPYSTWKSKMSGTKLEGTIVAGSSDASIKTSHLVEDPKVPSGGTILVPPMRNLSVDELADDADVDVEMAADSATDSTGD